MYIPSRYRCDDHEQALDWVRRYPFGLLVSAAGGTPSVSHLPFLLDDDGRHLHTHVARPNPHWHEFREPGPVLAVFNGPHAYVSPGWYREARSVPTWNYVAVHVSGRCRVVDAPDEVRANMARLLELYEPAALGRWSLAELPASQVDGLFRGIAWLSIEIETVQAKAKLSQNRSATDRAAVAAHLAASAREDERAVAALMTGFAPAQDDGG